MPLASEGLGDTIAQLEEQSKGAKGALGEILRQREATSSSKAGHIKGKVSQMALNAVDQKERSAKAEARERLRSKELTMAPIAQDQPALAMALDSAIARRCYSALVHPATSK